MSESDKRLGATLRRWGSWLLKLPVPARFAITVVGGALGSIGVGVISEYAAYWYALSEGFRPPFEGIPYLRPTVSALTFISLITLALIFSLVYASLWLTILMVRNTLRFMHRRIIKGIASEKGISYKFFQLMELGRNMIPGSSKLFVTEYIRNQLATESQEEIVERYSARFTGESIQPGLLFIFLGLTILGLSFATSMEWELLNFNGIGFSVIGLWLVITANKAVRIGFSLFVAIVFFGGISLSLFIPTVYSSLLCTMKYGGDIPITLHIRRDGNPNMETVNGILALRTTTSLVIRQDGSSIHREYPITVLKAIDYASTRDCFNFH